VNRIFRGDTKAAFESCDHVLDGELRIGGQEHFYMETHSVRVVPSGEDGEIAVYTGEQHITNIQVNIASSNRDARTGYFANRLIETANRFSNLLTVRNNMAATRS